MSVESFLIKACFFYLEKIRQVFYSIPDSVILAGQVKSAGGPDVASGPPFHINCSTVSAIKILN